MACFKLDACDVCPRCGCRPGIVCGVQGFGLRLRGHDARCAQRMQRRGETPAEGRSDDFVSAVSRQPEDSRVRPSAAPTDWQSVRPSTAPTDWQSAVSRPSTQPSTATGRESASSRPSIRTIDTRASTDIGRRSEKNSTVVGAVSEKFEGESLEDSLRIQNLIRCALDEALESGELLGLVGIDPEIPRLQARLCKALDEAIVSGELTEALGNDREDQSSPDTIDKGVPWPPSSGQEESFSLPDVSESFRSTATEPQEDDDVGPSSLRTAPNRRTGALPSSSRTLTSKEDDMEVATKKDFCEEASASFTIDSSKVRSLHASEPRDSSATNESALQLENSPSADEKKCEEDVSKHTPRLSKEEQEEARLIYELCDKEASDSIELGDLVDVAVKHPDVAQFMGLQRIETPESIREQILEKIGRTKGITWSDFDAFISERRANLTENSSPLPRLSAEKEIDLVFEMCDINKSGRISFAEFAAFCVKHPEVAEVVGMKDNQKRRQADVLFAQLDSDSSGSITRKELRNFVWQRRVGADDSMESPEWSPDDKANECEKSGLEPMGKSRSRKGKKKPKAKNIAP